MGGTNTLRTCYLWNLFLPPIWWTGILPLQRWDRYLCSHPDRQFAEFLRGGFTRASRLDLTALAICVTEKGTESSINNPGRAQRYITEEVGALWLRRIPRDTHVHWSSIGLVPKDHQPGKFRLIIDLSATQGASVNNVINSSLTTLSYPKVYDAVALVKSAGRGALMAKLDLTAAYRHVSVHPDDQSLLAIRWGGAAYINTTLPFGLCSAPKLFTAMADGLAWCMMCEGVSDFLHYLADFFCPQQSNSCGRSLQVAVELCEHLGFRWPPTE